MRRLLAKEPILLGVPGPVVDGKPTNVVTKIAPGEVFDCPDELAPQLFALDHVSDPRVEADKAKAAAAAAAALAGELEPKKK